MNDGSPKLKVAVIFINFGPYHFARARALAETDGISPAFIQLVGSVATHPWLVPDECRTEVRLVTLSNQRRKENDYLYLAHRLTTTLNRIDPAVVLTSSYRPFVMLFAARWARSRGRPAVLFFENTPWDRQRFPPFERIKQLVIKRYYAAAFATGRSHTDYLIRLGVPRSRIWGPYDVVDNDYFASKAALVSAAHDRWREQFDLPLHYFLYVGRYSQEKNLCRLLQAYRLYRENNRAPWSMLLLGDGPQRSTLQSLVSRLRLEGIIFRSFVQYDELPAYYALAECFLLPSTSEPWGLVVNEAMACGLPVILSRLCGCTSELLRPEKNGFCFDPYDIQGIASALERIAGVDASARRRMGGLSRTIISRFTPRTWADGLADCLRVVGENSGL